MIQAFTAGDPALGAVGNGPVDIVLVDADEPGSGTAFDWALADAVPAGVRLLLAGGLNGENVAQAIRRVRPWGVDVCTGVETTPGSGRKDARKLRRFIEQAAVRGGGPNGSTPGRPIPIGRPLRLDGRRRLNGRSHPYDDPMTTPARGEAVRLDPPGPEPVGLGRFGEFGGRFVPETLVPALIELEDEFRAAWGSDEFRDEFAELLRYYAGRPTPVTECHRLSERLGLRVFLKREDLTHTGSHKINNVLGQALLTRRMGKRRVIAETGAGQHGVATATAAALFGLDCLVFMGAVDVERQALNVFRMQLLGAEVVPVTGGSATLKDAINEALRDWVATVESTHYCIGSVVGPHPYPWIVREFQRVVGDEAREQCRAFLGGDDPDVVVACVGGGFERDGHVRRFRRHPIAAGRRGSGRSRARLGSARRVGESRGAGRAPRRAFAVPAGRRRPDHRDALDQRGPRLPGGRARSTPSSRPNGRAEYHDATDDEAVAGFQLLAVTEGIVPALEPAHAIGWLAREAGRSVPTGSTVLVTLSGRGDKDAAQIAERLTGEQPA